VIGSLGYFTMPEGEVVLKALKGSDVMGWCADGDREEISSKEIDFKEGVGKEGS